MDSPLLVSYLQSLYVKTYVKMVTPLIVPYFQPLHMTTFVNMWAPLFAAYSLVILLTQVSL